MYSVLDLLNSFSMQPMFHAWGYVLNKINRLTSYRQHCSTCNGLLRLSVCGMRHKTSKPPCIHSQNSMRSWCQTLKDDPSGLISPSVRLFWSHEDV